MGSFLPKIQRHKKPPPKEKPPTFLYSNMVRIQQIHDINQHYKFIGKIGQGSSGYVHKAVPLTSPNLRAIKVIEKQSHSEGVTSLMEMEFAILKTLDHPNIVKMYEILESPTHVYIVTELCQGEELFDILIRVKQFPQKVARQILFQTASALQHMHRHHFMHRDIKPENIIYNDQTKTIKLIDLSSAIFFETSEPTNRKRIGTSYYIAPEVLERCYNEKCDIWSLGVIMYILLSGQPPFSGESDIDILKNVLYGKLQFSHPIWNKISTQARRLIQKMMERDVSKRISTAAIMEDPWFKEYLREREKDESESNHIVNALLNLNKFKEVKSANIQNGVLIFIVNFVNKSDNDNELIRSFKALDLNGDGMLSLQELSLGLQKYMKLPLNEARLLAQRIFDRVDVNKSGFIDYSQFLVAASSIEVAISEENIDLAFGCFDANKDGCISVRQFREKLGTNISEVQYQNLISEFDLNNDGVISRQEFKKMMGTLLQKPRA